MLAVTDFSISENSFTGTLPESGILRKVTALRMHSNRLAGMLPEGICVEAVTRVYIFDNFFAGTVAESLLPLNSNPKLRPPKKRFFGSHFHSPRTLPAALSRSSHA
eukprot:4813148-Amphidinium_carterae.1